MKCEECGNDIIIKGDASYANPPSQLACEVGNFQFCSVECKNNWWAKHHIATRNSTYRFIIGMNIFILPRENELAHPHSEVMIFLNVSVFVINRGGHGVEVMHLEFDIVNKMLLKDGKRITFMNEDQIAREIADIIADKV